MSNNYDNAYWHASVTRELPWPSGGSRKMTMERIFWGSFDALVKDHGLEQSHIVEFCIESAIRKGHDFDEAFPQYLAYLDHEYTDGREVLERAMQRVPWKHGQVVSRLQIDQLQEEIDVLEQSRRGTISGWCPPD